MNFQGPDVENFNPDRFIGKDGDLLPALADTKDGMSSLLPFRVRIVVSF